MDEKTYAQRIPTEELNKKKVLELLEAITVLYQKTLTGVQVAFYENKLDNELISNLYNYVSFVISLYKVVRPKIQLISGKKFNKLMTIDKYIALISVMDKNVNLDTVFIIFQVFNELENLLRDLCEELGYTKDVPADYLK